MLQAPIVENTIPFSYEALIGLYQGLDFASRAKTLKLFMTPNAPIPTTNPPYPSSTFLERTKHIVTTLSYLLGYHNDQWIDEAIIGFLSILSVDAKPTVMFNYAQFLADAIDDQFLKFQTEGVFKYTSVLLYMFTCFQSRKFEFDMIK